MAEMNRCRVTWTGFVGAPGYTNFYFGSTTTDMTALKTFLTNQSSWIPSVVTLSIPAGGDKINDTDGKISGTWVGTGSGTVNGGGGAGSYSGSSGIVVDWLCGLIVAGRRVQGRSYFVPASTNAYQADGSITESIRTNIVTAGTTMIAAYAGEFKVFSRPFPGKDAETGPPPKPAKPPRVGVAATVITCRVPDIAAVMRSRRG